MATRPAIFKWHADRTGPDSQRGALVPSVLPVASGCRRAFEGTRLGRSTTPPFGTGCSVTVPNWRSGCGGTSKPTNKSWRVDETYVRVKGRWCYLQTVIGVRGHHELPFRSLQLV